MHMTFYWGWDATILFDFWKTAPDGVGGFWASVAILFVISILYQWLLAFRHEREQYIARARNEHLKPLVASPDDSNESSFKIPSPKTVFRNAALARMQLVNTVVFIVQVAMSYLLMLAVMCFNAGIFIAICLGLGVGYFFFHLRSGHAAQRVEELCH